MSWYKCNFQIQFIGLKLRLAWRVNRLTSITIAIFWNTVIAHKRCMRFFTDTCTNQLCMISTNFTINTFTLNFSVQVPGFVKNGIFKVTEDSLRTPSTI